VQRLLPRIPILMLCATCVALGAQASNQATSERQQAFALEQQGQYGQAQAEWQSILKAHPEDAEALAHLGLIASRQERYQDAATYYRKALELNPGTPGLRLNLGLALFKGGEMKEAAPVFAQLLKSATPGSPDAQRYTLLLAMSYYGAQEYSQAVPLFKQAVAGDPQNLALRITLAHSCLWSKQYQCVLDTYHDILALNAASAEADMLAGEAYDGLHNRGGAIEQFRAAVKANPQEPNVHFGLGYLLWTQNQLEEAASEFQAELANDPKHTQAMLYLGDTWLQLNQPDKARPLLEQAAQADPSEWRAHLDLGILAADAGQNEEALRQMLLAAKQRPEEVNIHMRLGRLYKAMGKSAESRAEFAKANTLTHANDEDLVRKLQPKQPVVPSTPQ
jgi:tetratricopeptide (TPR) repeat protein